MRMCGRRHRRHNGKCMKNRIDYPFGRSDTTIFKWTSEAVIDDRDDYCESQGRSTENCERECSCFEYFENVYAKAGHCIANNIISMLAKRNDKPQLDNCPVKI